MTDNKLRCVESHTYPCGAHTRGHSFIVEVDGRRVDIVVNVTTPNYDDKQAVSAEILSWLEGL